MIGCEFLPGSDPAAPRSDGGARLEVVFQSGSGFFEGHFPGAPLLPAVAQLALAEEVARRLLGRAAALLEVLDVRFRLPVAPGERLEVRLSAAGELRSDGTTPARFTVLRGAARVCSAELVFADAGPEQEPLAVTAPRSIGAQGAAMDAYLPQRGPALLVTEVLEATPQSSCCVARVPATSPFLRAGGFPSYLTLEMGAQAAAAAESLARRRAQPDDTAAAEPQAGYLVGVRRASFARALLPGAADYRVQTRRLRSAPPLRAWQVEVTLAGSPVASAEVSTFAV